MICLILITTNALVVDKWQHYYIHIKNILKDFRILFQIDNSRKILLLFIQSIKHITINILDNNIFRMISKIKIKILFILVIKP